MNAIAVMSGRLSGRAELPSPDSGVGTRYLRESAHDSVDAGKHRQCRGSYVTHSRLWALAQSVTERELSILRTLESVHVATGGQLLRLHCLDYAEPGDRQCRRVLRTLTTRGFISRLGRSIGGRRGGSAGWVYALDIAGQRILNRVASNRRRRPWTPGLPFLLHALAVTEVYVRLVEASRGGELQLRHFVTEPKCWRRFGGPAGEIVCKPDAYVVTHIGEFEDRWFVEVDLATESSSTLSRKLDVYRALWQSGNEQTASGVFPRVLWLVPSERRKDLLVTVLGRQPAEAWQLFQVARFDQAVEAMTATD